MVTIANNQAKICPDCQSMLPLDAFRLRKRGSNLRQGICRRCYNAGMRLYRQAHRSKTIRRFSAELRQERDSRKVTALCTAMFARFGGLDKFSAAWKAHMDAAPPGSRAALDSYLALLRLIEIANTPAPQPDCSLYSDEELREEMDRCVTDKAVRLLEGLG
jgi:hypothetical protein